MDGEPALIAKPDVRRVFMYDAEANLIQWCFAAAPNDPVLLRAIELSTARILAREPNIFIATGPSVFTDAFIALHSEGRRGGKQRRRRRLSCWWWWWWCGLRLADEHAMERAAAVLATTRRDWRGVRSCGRGTTATVRRRLRRR